MKISTLVGVPGSRRSTPPRSTQIADGPWQRFGEIAEQLGTTRAALMRDLVLWFVGWPGAKMPKRPRPGETK